MILRIIFEINIEKYMILRIIFEINIEKCKARLCRLLQRFPKPSFCSEGLPDPSKRFKDIFVFVFVLVLEGTA